MSGTPGWHSWTSWRRSMASLTSRMVAREAEQIVATMPIARPFSLERLLAAVERRTGRTVVVHPVPDRLLAEKGKSDVTGLLWRSLGSSHDVCLHQASASPRQRERILLSQLVHLWCSEAPAERTRQAELPHELAIRLGAPGEVIAFGPLESRMAMRVEAAADLIQLGGRHSSYPAPSRPDLTAGACEALDRRTSSPDVRSSRLPALSSPTPQPRTVAAGRSAL